MWIKEERSSLCEIFHLWFLWKGTQVNDDKRIIIMFTCRHCKRQLSSIESKKGSVTGIGTGCCRDCNSKRTRERQLFVQTSNSPHLYMNCDECDKTFSIYKPGNNSNTIGPRKKNIDCPFCGSEEIKGLNEK